MAWWWFAALAAALACAVCACVAYRCGRRAFGDSSGGASRTHGHDAARHLAALMDQTLVLVDPRHGVVFADDRARRTGLVSHDSIADPQIRDVVRLVAVDGQPRTREIAWTRGERHGHWNVAVGMLDERRCAVLVRDADADRRRQSLTRDLVGNVSHELKTPIGAINLLAEAMRDAPEDPQTVSYFSERILIESQRLDDLVQKLIELGRSERHDPDLVVLDVRAAVREAVERTAATAVRRDVSVDVREPGGAEPFARGPRGGLVVALKNLIENAVNYSPEHGVVVVDVTVDAGEALVRVIDHGIGIPADRLDRIFERFYRVDPARSRETGGTGLGLSIARQYVHACGGSIRVWSHEGQGSTFTVRLPLAER